MKKINETLTPDIPKSKVVDPVLSLGDKDNPGVLNINSKGFPDQHGGNIQTVPVFTYSAETGVLVVGNAYANAPLAKIVVHEEGSRKGIELNGDGSMYLGGTGDGKMHFLNHGGQETILIDGKNANIVLGGVSASNGDKVDGDITIKNATGSPTVQLQGSTAEVIIGGVNSNGGITINNAENMRTILLDGANGNIVLGGGKSDGDLTIKNTAGNDSVVLTGDGDIFLGGVGSNGEIIVKNSNDVETIKIKGSSGDIEFLNADFAEDFDIAEDTINEVHPGTVMSLNQKGTLEPCCKSYDGKVVGVIAGAGKYKPGIVMDKSGAPNRLPVAIMGKVYCKVDARKVAIEIGDLVTTSEERGCAMKATDKIQAFGTVIGKALQPAKGSITMIPILVNLQ